jgi:hypothetical protein
VRLTAAKAGLGRHRKLRLARPQGLDSGSAPEDGELRSARPRARTRAQPRKTANSAPPDPRLRLGLSPGRRRTPLRPTQGSDSGSAPEDGKLRSARPRARTRAQPRKTANSAPPDPGLGHGLNPGRRRTPPRPTPGFGHGLNPGRRRTPPRPTWGLGLDLDLGGASTSPSLGHGPTTSTGSAIITLPELTRATGNQTGVPSGSLHHASNDGAPHAL